MEARIKEIVHGDVLEINRLLKDSKAITTENVMREVLEHLNNGIALKLEVDGKIEGVWCSKDMGEFTSLSFFYVSTRMRGTLWVLELFKSGVNLIDENKPLLVETADTTGFDRYFEHVKGNVYAFKGFR